jgi:hypothetical protein
MKSQYPNSIYKKKEFKGPDLLKKIYFSESGKFKVKGSESIPR